MLNVVLVEPEIPANTGNIGRTCVLTGARLHLVGPLGFSLSEKALRRAGLAYWQSLDVLTYDSWHDFVEKNEVVWKELQPHHSDAAKGQGDERPFCSERQRPSRAEGTAHALYEGHPLPAQTEEAAYVPHSTDANQEAPRVHLLTKAGDRTYTDSTYHDGDYLVFGKESSGLSRDLLQSHRRLCERIPMRGDSTLANASAWHQSHESLHPELRQDVCGNFVDPREFEVASLNLSNAVAIVLYEALRQTGFAGM